MSLKISYVCNISKTICYDQGCGVARSRMFLGGVGIRYLRSLGVDVQLNHFIHCTPKLGIPTCAYWNGTISYEIFIKTEFFCCLRRFPLIASCYKIADSQADSSTFLTIVMKHTPVSLRQWKFLPCGVVGRKNLSLFWVQELSSSHSFENTLSDGRLVSTLLKFSDSTIKCTGW